MSSLTTASSTQEYRSSMNDRRRADTKWSDINKPRLFAVGTYVCDAPTYAILLLLTFSLPSTIHIHSGHIATV